MKKIAVVLDNAQSEGLRMALGLTLSGNTVSLFVVGQALADEPAILENLEALKAMGGTAYSDRPDELGTGLIDRRDLPAMLLEQDHVVVY